MRENNLLNSVPLQFPSFYAEPLSQENVVHTTTQFPATQTPQQSSYRGHLSKHEGPLQLSQMRGIVAGYATFCNFYL